MLASEVPYVIGFLALVVLAFWLVGRAADSGALTRRLHANWYIAGAVFFTAAAIVDAASHQWVGTAIWALNASLLSFDIWRRRQRS